MLDDTYPALAFLLLDVQLPGSSAVTYRAFRVCPQRFADDPDANRAEMGELIRVLREYGYIPGDAIVSHPIYLETNDRLLPIAPDGRRYRLEPDRPTL